MNAVIVRVAHAGPRPGKVVTGEPGADLPQRGLRRRGSLVVLADDAGRRALPAWVAEQPDDVPLPDLLDRPADDIWTTASVPEELAVRLADAAGGTVTGVEIYPLTAEPGEVNADTCAARIELGPRHVTARLDQGLRLAVVTGAPVRVDAAVLDRLAVPVPAGDPAAPFRRPPDERGHVVISRREGGGARVLHVPPEPGPRPRFEPRNMTFADGLTRWHLDGADYSATAEDSCAILSSPVRGPSGPAALLQTVFADDYRGAPVIFSGEFRTEDAAEAAGLCLRILGKGWDVDPDRVQERVVTVTGSRGWSRAEVSAWVPDNTDIVRFGIMLAGTGRVWLRNPDLRRDDA